MHSKIATGFCRPMVTNIDGGYLIKNVVEVNKFGEGRPVQSVIWRAVYHCIILYVLPVYRCLPFCFLYFLLL